MVTANTSKLLLPKVLIIGDSFSNVGGGGITMTNLFKGWPKDRIAVATTNIVASGLESCSIYYRLGYLENKRYWPLHYLQPKYTSGPVIFNENHLQEEAGAHHSKPSKYPAWIKASILKIIQILGLSFLQERLRVTEEFLNWIREYQPDLIYTQLATYELIKFTQEVKRTTNIPVAIHIMDDWPKSLNKPGILYFYWKYRLDREFRKLLAMSDIFLSICDAMSHEYEKRYGIAFRAFHNPIITGKWIPFSKQDWHINESFKIIYTGRIGTANGKAIVEIAAVVSQLRALGNPMELDIYSPDGDTPKARLIGKLDGVTIKKPVPHASMPTLLPQYDLAVLPLDFDRAGIRFAQFSMPTKASEYMISATPVMIYADSRTALAQYAGETGWGYVVTRNNQHTLREAFLKLYQDAGLREKLGCRAREISAQNENADHVIQNFRDTLATCLNQ